MPRRGDGVVARARCGLRKETTSCTAITAAARRSLTTVAADAQRVDFLLSGLDVVWRSAAVRPWHRPWRWGGCAALRSPASEHSSQCRARPCDTPCANAASCKGRGADSLLRATSRPFGNAVLPAAPAAGSHLELTDAHGTPRNGRTLSPLLSAITAFVHATSARRKRLGRVRRFDLIWKLAFSSVAAYDARRPTRPVRTNSATYSAASMLYAGRETFVVRQSGGQTLSSPFNSRYTFARSSRHD